MPIVNDVDRPDVNGVPPKMLAICEATKEALNGLVPYLSVTTNDNLGSSVCIRGALEPKEEWPNGIFQNATYFIVFIWPFKGKRYYEEGEKVTLELSSGWKVPKLRKYSAAPEKVVGKLKDWISKCIEEKQNETG